MTEQAAAEFVRRHGSGALTILADRAEIAAELSSDSQIGTQG